MPNFKKNDEKYIPSASHTNEINVIGAAGERAILNKSRARTQSRAEFCVRLQQHLLSPQTTHTQNSGLKSVIGSGYVMWHTPANSKLCSFQYSYSVPVGVIQTHTEFWSCAPILELRAYWSQLTNSPLTVWVPLEWEVINIPILLAWKWWLDKSLLITGHCNIVTLSPEQEAGHYTALSPH